MPLLSLLPKWPKAVLILTNQEDIMSTTIQSKHNRRSFLKISAAAGGGLILGFNWMSCNSPSDILVMPDQWFDLNAFLKIGDNGVVTIMSPNPEIGQNVKTSMPMIIAEELDVDWNNVIVKQAPLDSINYVRQIAGGSQSIRFGWKALRTTGATARYLLMKAAAKIWDVDMASLKTEKGFITNANGDQLGYGEVAKAAAELPSPAQLMEGIKEAAAKAWEVEVADIKEADGNLAFGDKKQSIKEIAESSGLELPPEIQLKDNSTFSIIGTDRLNVDGKEIVTGKPLFGLDTKKKGMLYAGIIQPPAFGMKLKSFDAEEAKSMTGIKDVFKINTLPEGVQPQWSDVNAFTDLIAVVGASTWQVFKAKKAIAATAQWENASPIESSEDHDRALSNLLNQSAQKADRDDGDTSTAMSNAAQVIEKEYSAPFLAHNTMEPMNFFADVTAEGAYLEGPIQTPIFLRGTVAKVLGLPDDKVKVMMTRQGGGFGRRLYGHFGTEAAVISQKVGAPIQLVYTREDDMTKGCYRPAYKIRYKAGLDADGNMIAFEARGAGVNEPRGLVFANRFPAGAVDNFKAENHNLPSNITCGAWRAPRSNFIAYAEQSFIDEVAEAAGKDPIDFRLALFDSAENNPVGNDHDYDASRYAGVLKLVKEKAGWGKDMGDIHRGVSAYYCHNTYVAQIVDVIMNDGIPRVKKVWCAVDCGIVVNPIAAKNQLEGGIVDGIGHAMYGGMAFEDGQSVHSNYDTYRLIRHAEAPEEIECFFVENGIDPTGLGEPSLPPIQSALANALYKATGKRLYDQPFNQKLELLG